MSELNRPENISTKQAIAHWRDALKPMADAQRDELEDHLRSELADLDRTPLSPRERVLVAADRIGDPRALSEAWARESSLVFAAPRWLVLTTIFALIALGGLVEIEREIDEVLEAALGRDGRHLLLYACQGLAVALCLSVGFYLARAAMRQDPPLALRLPLRTHWPILVPIGAAMVLGIAMTPHMIRELFNEIDEPIEAALGHDFKDFTEFFSLFFLAGAIVAAGLLLMHVAGKFSKTQAHA